MKASAKAVFGWLLAFFVAASLGGINYCGFKLIQLAEVKPPSQTVVYIQGGEGSQGVPFYDAPVHAQPAVGLLRNFTPVDMICWADDETHQRWFYVRVGPNESSVREGRIVAVRAVHTWNQTQTDKC